MNAKIHALVILFLCLVCFGVYVSTAARAVTWAHFANSGPQLLTQIYTQPLTWNLNLPYLLAAKMTQKLTAPLNLNPAFPFNLLSAFWASLTIGAVYLINLSLAPILKKPPHLTKPPNLIWLPPVFGALTLAFSPTFWSQALVTQTTAFNFFFFSLFLLLLLKIDQGPGKKSLGLISWSCFFLFLFLLRHLLLAKLAFRFRTWKEVFANLEAIFFLTTANFKTIPLILALIGLTFGLEKRKPRFLLLGLFSGQIVFDSLFLTATTPAFFLLSFLTIALFAGLGFKVLLEIILAVSLSDLAVSFENRFFLLIFNLKKTGRVLKYLSLGLLGYLTLATLLTSFQKTYPLVDLKKETAASEFGQGATAALPQKAIVFCEDEKLLFTLDYFSRVISPDQEFEVSLFDPNSRARIKAEIDQRPIFFALSESPISPGKTVGKWEGYTLVSQGPLYQIQKPRTVK